MNETGFTDATLKTDAGEWTAREHDNGSWEILNASGERQGWFQNARIMALHLAMVLAENVAAEAITEEVMAAADPANAPSVWPDTKLEAQMIADVERIPKSPYCEVSDIECHVKALLARIRELEALVQAATRRSQLAYKLFLALDKVRCGTWPRTVGELLAEARKEFEVP